MRWYATFVLALTTAIAAAADKPEPLAGWFGVFPELQGYQRAFAAPVVTKGEKPTEYKQAVTYDWTGGAAKRLEVTLARDPAFKKAHAADALKKTDPAPKEVKVGKRDAWLWDLSEQAKGKPDAAVARLVVPLGDDTAAVFVAKQQGPWEPLDGLAEKFDLAAIAEALKAAPRTDFARTVEAFRAVKKGAVYADVRAWAGEADGDIGSGIHIMEYKLADGTRVLVGTPDFKKVMYVKHEGKDGKIADLAK